MANKCKQSNNYFALIYYLDNPSVYHVISVNNILEFYPTSETDFRNYKQYAMRWFGSEDDILQNPEQFDSHGRDVFNWYAGAIIKLSGSRNKLEIELKDKSKRIHRETLREHLSPIERKAVEKGITPSGPCTSKGVLTKAQAYKQNKESCKLKQTSQRMMMQETFYGKQSSSGASKAKLSNKIKRPAVDSTESSEEEIFSYDSDNSEKNTQKISSRVEKKNNNKKKKVDIHGKCEAEIATKDLIIENLKAEITSNKSKIKLLNVKVEKLVEQNSKLTATNNTLQEYNFKYQALNLASQTNPSKVFGRVLSADPSSQTPINKVLMSGTSDNEVEGLTAAGNPPPTALLPPATVSTSPTFATATASDPPNEAVEVFASVSPILETNTETQATAAVIQLPAAAPATPLAVTKGKYIKKKDSKDNLYGLFDPLLEDLSGTYPKEMSLLPSSTSQFHIINGVTLTKTSFDNAWTNSKETTLTMELIGGIKTTEELAQTVWQRESKAYETNNIKLDINVKKALVYVVLKKRSALGLDVVGRDALAGVVARVQKSVTNAAWQARNELGLKKKK